MLLTTLWLMAFAFKWKSLASPDHLVPAPGRVCVQSQRIRRSVPKEPSKYLTCSPHDKNKYIWRKRSCKPSEVFVAKKQRCQPRSMVKRQESVCRTQPDLPVCLQAQQNAHCQAAQPGFQVAPGAPCDWVSAPLEPYTTSPNFFLQCNPTSLNNGCGAWNQMQCSNGTVFSMFVQICITVAISQASCPAGEIGMFPCGTNSWCPSGATCRDGVCCQSASVSPESLSTQAPPTIYPQQLTTAVQPGSLISQTPVFPPVGQPQPGQPGFPQPGHPGFPQPGQPGFPQPGQPGFPQPGQPRFPQPGQPWFPQPGQPGFPQPGQPGFPQPGQPGFSQPGQPGFPQPGQPGFPQPGQPGFPQPGQPGFSQPGQPGFPQPQPGQQTIPQTGQLGYPQPQPGQPIRPQPGQPIYPQQPSQPGQPIYPQQPQPGQPFPQQPQPGQPVPQPGQPMYPQTAYPPYMPGQPGYPAQQPFFPQPPAPPGYPQPQPAFPPPLSYPYPQQPGFPPQQPHPPNVLQPPGPPGQQQPGQPQPSWPGYQPQQPIPPAPGYPQPFTQPPVTLYPPMVPFTTRGVDIGFFTTPRNLPFCPDNQLANTFCKDNYDCPENQYCYSGGCCQLSRCPSGVMPVNHCHDLHDCLPNQYCYNSGCCPVQSCPNGEAPTRSCDDKNPCPSSLTCQSGGCCSSSLPDCPNGDSASMPCSGSGTCPSGQFCHTDKGGYKHGCCDIPKCPNGSPAFQPCGSDNSCPAGLLCLNNACCGSPSTGAFQTYGATTAIYPALPYTVGPFVPPPTLAPGMVLPSPVVPVPPRACSNCCPTFQVAICFCATLNVCPQMTTCSNRGACCASRDALPFYSAKRPGDRCYSDAECPGFDAGTSRCSNGYCICVPGAISNGFSCVRMPQTQYYRYGKRKHPGKKNLALKPIRRIRDLSRLENYDNEISQRKFASNSSHSAERSQSSKEDDFDELVVGEEQLIYWRTFEQNHCITDNECIPEMICVAGKCKEIIYSLHQPNCDHDDQCNRSIPHTVCVSDLDNLFYSNSSATVNRVCRCKGDYYEHHQQCVKDCPDGTEKVGVRCLNSTNQTDTLSPSSGNNNSTEQENKSLAAVS